MYQYARLHSWNARPRECDHTSSFWRPMRDFLLPRISPLVALLPAALLLAACTPAFHGGRYDSTTASQDSADTAGHGDSGGAGDSSIGGCPAGSVPVVGASGTFCIDAYETTISGDPGNIDQGAAFPDGSTKATSKAKAGVQPTQNVSWYQAYAICAVDGRHLCTVDEWQTACGPYTYPWGDAPSAQTECAVANSDGTTSRTDSQPAGSLTGCVSPQGVYDQIGNLWEWADPGVKNSDGTPGTAKLGGAWYAGAGDALCGLDPHTEHPPTFDGTIGFRCCSEP